MLQADAQILRGDLVSPAPLLFEVRTLSRETFLDLLDSGSHELIRLFNRFARLVDEAGLNGGPSTAKVLHLIRRQQ